MRAPAQYMSCSPAGLGRRNVRSPEMTTAVHSASPRVSVNALAAPRVAALVAAAPQLRLGVTLSEQGATIVDAGIAARGGLEAGRRIAEICMGGLGLVALAPGEAALGGLPEV